MKGMGKSHAGIRNGRVAAVSLAGSWALLVGFSGCVSNANSGLTIEQAQVPESDEEDGCTVPAGQSETYLASGRLDVGLDRDYPYYLYPLVKNNLAISMTATRGEINYIQLEGFRVKLAPPTGLSVDFKDCPAEFDFPNPKRLEPGSSAVGGVQAILPCHVARIRAALERSRATKDTEASFVASVRAKGRHGGTAILSDNFNFPIKVCLGCLQRGFFAPGFEKFDYPDTPLCANLSDNPFTGNSCNIAQDFGPVLCCALDDSGTKIECPGRPRPTVTMP